MDLSNDPPIWEEVQSLPSSQQFMGLLLTLEDGFLYYFGGARGSIISSKVAKYDIELNQWTDANANMVMPLKNQCGVAHKGFFWIIGGETTG